MGSVELYWIPLGADGNPMVRAGGWLYEWIAARREDRPARQLFHSALVVRPDETVSYAIEMAPVWSSREPARGVVVEGPVGRRWLGRSRMFRYEVRRWRNGVIPDLGAAGDPVVLEVTRDQAHRLLDLVPAVPALTWGRDERGTGEMWNSNSLVSWLLSESDLPTDLAPPHGGRAPGWAAGLALSRTSPSVRNTRQSPRTP
jgi:hypothetical protein